MKNIKELNAEVAWLQAENEGLKAANELAGMAYNQAQAEISRLKALLSGGNRDHGC